MKNAKKVYTRLWRGCLVVVCLVLLAYLLYFHRLGTLLPGYSEAELASYNASSDWRSIFNNPTYAPFKVLVWVTGILLHGGILATRIVAAVFGILAVLAFYFIARLRYRFWLAGAGTILFAASAGFLHAARLGTGMVLQLGILAMVLGVLWYRTRPAQRTIICYFTAVVWALMLYVPGMIWFELFGLVLLLRKIREELPNHPVGHLLAWAALYTAVITPLALAIIRNAKIGLEILGFPQNLQSLTYVPQHLLDTALAIGIRGTGDPLLSVGHVPLLNVAEVVLAIIGVYTYCYIIRRTNSKRAFLLIGGTILAVLLASLGGDASLIYLVPLLYLFVISGLHYFIGQWLSVFPRNPIARSTGVAVISIMLVFSVLYQVRSYFVAWPHNTVTRHEFSHPAPNHH